MINASRATRVGFVSAGDDEYGVRRSLEGLFRGFQDQGVEPVLICLEAGPMMELGPLTGAETHACAIGVPRNFGSFADAFHNLAFMARASAALAKVLKRLDLEAVIVRQGFQVPLTARAAHIAGVPSFWLMPNLVSDRYPLRLNARIYDLLLARYGMTAIANSHYTRTSLLGRRARSAVSHLGINPETFAADTRPADRAAYGFEPGDALFGIFARMVEFKGQLEFVQAIGRAAGQHPDARLLIVGGPIEGDYAAKVRAEIDRLGLGGKVLLAGPANRLPDGMPALYAMCDVIVNARIDPEPFGLSVIEGMLMAKPLLVHALGGPAETVVDGEDGWHVTEPTASGFAAGIDRAMADRGPARDRRARRR
ncbi:glycosyltransferase family 4 protein, partial [Sphingomonas bacterium]|uniref:glycosyltransferase family 4 protein n=1 Tax=Sphingomonas bacterium TaxID=1895847 RepID=UPI001576F664